MRSLVVAPHPDDELLGCGGTLLSKSSEGGTIGWLLITAITQEAGWSIDKISKRDSEIELVRQGLGIATENLYKLGLPSAQLDQIPSSKIISSISHVFNQFKPHEVFLPHPGDIHSDHRITFEAASACTKWFRYPSIKRVLTYETLSETNFGLDQAALFRPNLFVDITDHLSTKLELLQIYESELGHHPFPRSMSAVKSQSLLRGSERGVLAAEAFQILRSYE
jgi:LmbE family N-acetylglucosaminyl deacetylase